MWKIVAYTNIGQNPEQKQRKKEGEKKRKDERKSINKWFVRVLNGKRVGTNDIRLELELELKLESEFEFD